MGTTLYKLSWESVSAIQHPEFYDFRTERVRRGIEPAAVPDVLRAVAANRTRGRVGMRNEPLTTPGSSLGAEPVRADKRLRRMWLERSVAQGWSPWQSRFLLRAATKPDKPYGPFRWAPTWYPL